MTNSSIELKALTEQTAKATAGTIERFLATKDISLKRTAALDLVGVLTGHADWRSLKAHIDATNAANAGKPTRISLDEFIERFKPMKNKIDANACFDGFAFETYGEELKLVQEMAEKHPERVWTVVDGDVSSWLTSGFHFVNRLFYVLTHVGAPDKEFIEIAYGHDDDDKLFEITVLDDKNDKVVFKEQVYAPDAASARERLTCEIDNDGLGIGLSC